VSFKFFSSDLLVQCMDDDSLRANAFVDTSLLASLYDSVIGLLLISW
jgi:hypothetical protein